MNAGTSPDNSPTAGSSVQSVRKGDYNLVLSPPLEPGHFKCNQCKATTVHNGVQVSSVDPNENAPFSMAARIYVCSVCGYLSRMSLPNAPKF